MAGSFGSAKTFFERLSRSGTANNDMPELSCDVPRSFARRGAPHDDETVWKVLSAPPDTDLPITSRRLGGRRTLARARRPGLPQENTTKASSLCGALTDLSEEIAADGGDRDRTRLLTDLANKSIRIAEDRRS